MFVLLEADKICLFCLFVVFEIGIGAFGFGEKEGG